MKVDKREMAERYDMFFRSARALVLPKNTYIELGSGARVCIGDDDGKRYVQVQGKEGWERIYLDDGMSLNDFGEVLKRKGVAVNLFKFLEDNDKAVYSLYNHRGDEKGFTFLLNELRRAGVSYRLMVEGSDRARMLLSELKGSIADKLDDLLRDAGRFIKALFNRGGRKPADYRASYDAERFVEKNYGISL